MRFLDLTLPTAAENLALDEALLLDAEEANGPEALRVWEWPHPAVVLGAGGILAADVNEPACAADGVPVLRRNSGGGTVLLGSGCLNFSLALRYERTPALGQIGTSYCYILNRVCAALGRVVPDAAPAGTSDLAIHGLKFSGNAQQRKRTTLLHHGTLLYGFDLDCVGKYLRMPGRQPEYRAGRDHAAFLMNLPLDVAELKQGLRMAWNARKELLDWPRTLTQTLLREKYTNREWIRRR